MLKKVAFDNEGADDDQFAHVHINLKNVCCDLLKSRQFLRKVQAKHVGTICVTLGSQLRPGGHKRQSLRQVVVGHIWHQQRRCSLCCRTLLLLWCSTFQVTLDTILANLPSQLPTGTQQGRGALSSGEVVVTALIGAACCAHAEESRTDIEQIDSCRTSHQLDLIEFARGGSRAAFDILNHLLVAHPLFLQGAGHQLLNVVLEAISARSPSNNVIQSVARIQKVLNAAQYAQLVTTIVSLADRAGHTSGASGPDPSADVGSSINTAVEVVLALCREPDPKLTPHVAEIVRSMKAVCTGGMRRAECTASDQYRDAQLHLSARAFKAIEAVTAVGMLAVTRQLTEDLTEFALENMGFRYELAADAQEHTGSSDSDSDSSSDSDSDSESDSDDGWGDSDSDVDGGFEQATNSESSSSEYFDDRSTSIREASAYLLASLISRQGNHLSYFAGRVLSDMDQVGDALRYRSARVQSAALSVIFSLWRLVSRAPSISSATHAPTSISRPNLQRQTSGRPLLNHFAPIVEVVARTILPENRRTMLSLYALMSPVFAARGNSAPDQHHAASCLIVLQQIERSISYRRPYDNSIDLGSEKATAIRLLSSLVRIAPALTTEVLKSASSLENSIISSLLLAARGDVDQVHEAAVACISLFPIFLDHTAVAASVHALASPPGKNAALQSKLQGLGQCFQLCCAHECAPFRSADESTTIDLVFDFVAAHAISKQRHLSSTALACTRDLLTACLKFNSDLSDDARSKILRRLAGIHTMLLEFVREVGGNSAAAAATSLALDGLRVAHRLLTSGSDLGSAAPADLQLPDVATMRVCVQVGDPAVTIAVLQLLERALSCAPGHAISEAEEIFGDIVASELAVTNNLTTLLKRAIACIGELQPGGTEFLCSVADFLLQRSPDERSSGLASRPAQSGAAPLSDHMPTPTSAPTSLGAVHVLHAHVLGTLLATAEAKSRIDGVFSRFCDVGTGVVARASAACCLGIVGRDAPALVEQTVKSYLVNFLVAERSVEGSTAWPVSHPIVVDNVAVAVGRIFSNNIDALKQLLDGYSSSATSLSLERDAALITVFTELLASAKSAEVQTHATYLSDRLQALVNVKKDGNLRKVAQALGRMVTVIPESMRALLCVSEDAVAELPLGQIRELSPESCGAAVVRMGSYRYAVAMARDRFTELSDDASRKDHGIFAECCHQAFASLLCTCPGQPLLNLKLYSFAVEALTVALSASVAQFAATVLPCLREPISVQSSEDNVSFKLWPVLRQLVVPNYTWKSTVVIGKMKKKKDLGAPLRIAVWNFLAALFSQFPHLLTTAHIVPYTAWGLKDDQMEVRVAAGDFLLKVMDLNPTVVDHELLSVVSMEEKSERKTSVVKDSLLQRLVKSINRNRAKPSSNDLEKQVCRRFAAVTFKLSQRAALRGNEEFATAVEYIKAGRKPSKGNGDPALLKAYWERMH